MRDVAIGPTGPPPGGPDSVVSDTTAARVVHAIGTDPTQAFILLDSSGRPRWASPSLASLVFLDLDQPNPLFAAMHHDDVALVAEIFATEQTGRADETFGMDRRFELPVRLRAPSGVWRWVALRLHNRLDDPLVDGMVLQLTLANQEHSTVEAFDAAALGEPTARVLEQVLATLASGGTGDAHAVVFDNDGRCVATTVGAPVAVGIRSDAEEWHLVSDGRVDVVADVRGPDGSVHGTLVTVSNFPDVRPFTRSLVEAVARRVGMVLMAERDRDELRRQAVTDPLTGLHNRRFLYDQLEREDLPPWMSVAFVDLDGFKGINDRCGHHVGDEVLTQVAERVRSATRPDDIVARVGGDEFVIVRLGEDPEECALDAGLLAAAVSGELLVAGHPVVLAASVGVITAPSSRGEAVIVEADQAMYRAKLARPR